MPAISFQNPSNGVSVTQKHHPGVGRNTNSKGKSIGKGNSISRLAPPSKNTNNTGKKKRRFSNRTIALREIRKYQRSYHLLIPNGPFKEMMRNIADKLTINQNGKSIKWSKQAYVALQHHLEMSMVRKLSNAYVCSLHAKRITLIPKDIQIASFIVNNE